MAARVGIDSMIAMVCDQDAPGADTPTYTLLRNLVADDASSAATAVAGAGSTVTVNRQPGGGGGFNALTSTIALSAADTVYRTTALVAAQKVFVPDDVVQFVHVNVGTHTRTIVLCTAPQIPGTA